MGTRVLCHLILASHPLWEEDMWSYYNMRINLKKISPSHKLPAYRDCYIILSMTRNSSSRERFSLLLVHFSNDYKILCKKCSLKWTFYLYGFGAFLYINSWLPFLYRVLNCSLESSVTFSFTKYIRNLNLIC